MEVLDRSRPLWELWFVDGLHDGSVGLLQKVHHALLDGVSSVEFVTTLLDIEPVTNPSGRSGSRTATPPGAADLVLDAWLERLRDPSAMFRDAGQQLRRAPGDAVGGLADTVGALTAWLGPSGPGATQLAHRPVGRHRRLLSTSMALSEIRRGAGPTRRVAERVALAVLTGGLRNWVRRPSRATHRTACDGPGVDAASGRHRREGETWSAA